MPQTIDFAPQIERVRNAPRGRWLGHVTEVVGLTIASAGPVSRVGEFCTIQRKNGGPLPAEVVGFRGPHTLLMPLGNPSGIATGDRVEAHRSSFTVRVGEKLLGRVLDGLGRPIDGKGPLGCHATREVDTDPIAPLDRTAITEPLATGIRAVDTLVTVGKGQRLGIFAGSGVGKSVLMGEMARYTKADVTVIGLIGERGREVREFVDKVLGEEGLDRSVVVAATSDQPALVRVKGAYVTTAIAEHFRDQGLDVLLMMDSVTRFCNAQREVGLAVGEPPATKGFTPSVFAMLPQLLERCGNTLHGSLTGLYTVLVDGDDLSEPVPDAIRAILDGHVVLSRKIASRGRYPSVDIHESVSRVMLDVISPEHAQAARKFKATDYTYCEAEDMIHIGAYVKGSDPGIDDAISRHDVYQDFLRQPLGEHAPFEENVAKLIKLVEAKPGKSKK